MGTSGSIPTPTTGNWKDVRTGLDDLSQNDLIEPPKEQPSNDTLPFKELPPIERLKQDHPDFDRGVRTIISNAVRGIERGKGDVSSGGRDAGGGFISRKAVRATSRGVGFFQHVHDKGFESALKDLRIDNFEEYSPDELIDVICEAIVEGRIELEEALLITALSEEVQEIMGNDSSKYEQNIKDFINNYGYGVFLKNILSKYTEQKVIQGISQATYDKIQSNYQIDAIRTTIRMYTNAEVGRVIDEKTKNVGLEGVNWFGLEGENIVKILADNIREDVENLI